MGKLLEASFYARPALVVARELLGKTLVRQFDGRQITGTIAETEAYVGPHDAACHASKGHTPRTSVMFGPAGVWYVYFIYGVHWMLNVVTADEGYPAAVLFRTVEPFNGPGKLTRALAIDKSLNGQPAMPSSGLWIEDAGLRVPKSRIARTPRIGVAYAGDWAEKPYRFVIMPPSRK